MNPRSFHRRRTQPGFTMIELMIAMILGLVVIAGITSVFLAGQQSFRTNNALSDVQDSSRVAFELMTRDLREAGYTGCGDSRIANVLNNGPSNGGTTWWANYGNMLMGYAGGTDDPAVTSGTAAGNRVKATDSLEVVGATTLPVSIISNFITDTFTLSGAASNLQAGDVIVACDYKLFQAAVVQTATVSGTSVTYAASGTPGNCTDKLSFPVSCAGGTAFVFSNGATLGKLDAVDWYVGYNPVGGTSLYRISLLNKGKVPTPTAQEMVRNVTGMKITYLTSGATAFVAAGSVANWATVTAVHVEMTVQSAFQRATVNAKPITRTFAFTTTLRNRVQ